MPGTKIGEYPVKPASSATSFDTFVAADAGEVLVAMLAINGTQTLSSITDGGVSSWNQLAAFTTSSPRIYMYVGVPFSANPGWHITFNWSASAGTGIVGLVSRYGGLTSSPADKFATGSGTGTAATTSATGTTTQADELVVAAFCSTTTTGTITAGSGFGNLSQLTSFGLNNVIATEDEGVLATGTQIGTLSYSTSRTYHAVVGTLKAAPTGASSRGQHFPFLGHHERDEPGAMWAPRDRGKLWAPPCERQRDGVAVRTRRELARV